MEALLAVGLASNVVQFVGFAHTLVSEANAIRKNGAPSSIPDLKDLAQRSVNQAAIIKTRLRASGDTLQQEHQYLHDTAEQCEVAGRSFLDFLAKLECSESNSSTRDSIRASIKFRWKHDQLREFVQLLDRLQIGLVSATTLACRSSSAANHEELVRHLREIQQHQETQPADMASISTNIKQLLQSLDSSLSRKIDDCFNSMCRLQLDQPPTESRAMLILRWLDFRQISWRYDTIDFAHNKTFEWIFSAAVDQRWSNFQEYLETSASLLPYFVNGKPGSGKSTLMKFLVRHEATREALRRWSQEKDLLIPSYYFWNQGTPLQKTFTGMLRSLLHTVLQAYPDLIPAVFPHIYQLIDLRNSSQSRNALGAEPTYEELKKAFDVLREKSAPFLRLCIFIDGIDELDGNHRDISRFLRSLSSSSLKLVVSSRPINACLHAFRGCPTLELQFLTRGDMDTLVRDRFDAHHLVPDFRKRWPKEMQELSSHVSVKAEGIFLWTCLVVELLLKGMEEGENLRELRRTLDSLPSDLRTLYQRMLSNVPHDQRVQTSQIFQLHRTWQQLTRPIDDFYAIILHNALSPLSDALSQPAYRLELETIDSDLDKLNDRIRSRCCGLLETSFKEFPMNKKSAEGQSWILERVTTKAVVGFIHRTVAEFLNSPDIWQDLCALTQGTDFDPAASLMSSCLWVLKGDFLLDGTNGTYAMKLVNYSMMFCQAATSLSIEQALQFVEAIDQSLISSYKRGRSDGQYWLSGLINEPLNLTLREICGGDGWRDDSVHGDLKRLYEDVGWRRLSGDFDIHSFVASCALPRYFNFKHSYTSKRSRYATVLAALRMSFAKGHERQHHACDRWSEDRLKTMSLLLTKVAKPDDMEEGVTLWEHALQTATAIMQSNCPVASEEAAGLLWLFVLHSRDRIRLWNLSFVRFDSGSFAQKLLEQFLHSPKREVRKKGLRIKQMLRDSRSVKMPREAGHYGRRVAQKRAYNTRTQRDKPFRSREVSS